MRPISIWRPSEKDGRPVWERPIPELLGDHYAAEQYLWPKTAASPTRICLFGESVAAGYLYAPHITPAKVLAGQLGFVAGQDGYEVIDLARTNETLAGLVETVGSAMQLEPDVLVIFAGNNWNLLETPAWSPYLPGVKGRMRYAEQLRAGGLELVIESAAKERLQKIWLALSEIGAIAQNAAVPVILVIPEVNLADWESCQPVHWLDGEALQSWYTFLAQARQALEDEDWERAAALAWQMLDLDESLCPTAYRLLVRANVGLGRLAVARKAAEAETGSSHYAAMAFLSAPQVGPADQEMMRRAAQFHAFTLVDLPKVLGSSELPGRELFLDYCHLTIKGMEWAMGQVTTAVIHLMKDERAYPLLDMLDGVASGDVTDEAVATAQFGAAIHNAHRLCAVTDKQELLVHWCRAALAASPGIHRAMIDFVAARSLPYPAVMTAEQQRLFNSPYLLQHQHGWKYGHLDAGMIQAILTALAEWEPMWAEAALDKLVENGALGRETISLLNPYYDADPLRRPFPELIPTPDMTGWGIYRAVWPVSRFCFVMTGSAEITLDICARLVSSTNQDSRVELLVNRKRVGEVAVGLSWQRQEVVVDSRFIQRGLNELAVRWPFPAVDKEVVWRKVIGRLEQGFDTTIHPVFGEIERLQIQRPLPSKSAYPKLSLINH
jgi:hypothetical protein